MKKNLPPYSFILVCSFIRKLDIVAFRGALTEASAHCCLSVLSKPRFRSQKKVEHLFFRAECKFSSLKLFQNTYKQQVQELKTNLLNLEIVQNLELMQNLELVLNLELVRSLEIVQNQKKNGSSRRIWSFCRIWNSCKILSSFRIRSFCRISSSYIIPSSFRIWSLCKFQSSCKKIELVRNQSSRKIWSLYKIWSLCKNFGAELTTLREGITLFRATLWYIEQQTFNSQSSSITGSQNTYVTQWQCNGSAKTLENVTFSNFFLLLGIKVSHF